MPWSNYWMDRGTRCGWTSTIYELTRTQNGDRQLKCIGREEWIQLAPRGCSVGPVVCKRT